MIKRFKDFIVEGYQDNLYQLDDEVSVNGRQDGITFKGEIGKITAIPTVHQSLYLINFPERFNGNLHDGNGQDPSETSYFVREELLTQLDSKKNENISRFYMSADLLEILNKLKNTKIGELYLSLHVGVEKDKVKPNYVNYLGIDEIGNVTFLKQRYFDENFKWTTTRREKMKSTKVIREILTDDYFNSIVKQTDIEQFSNNWSVIFKPSEILELRGDDVLRAYNYKREINLQKFGMSCANFGQSEPGGGGYEEPKVSWFDIYTKNPENIAAIVITKNGNIVGRRCIQQGEISRGPKIGKFFTFIGNYYGEGGTGSKYDTLIMNYIKEKYPESGEYSQGIVIKIGNTRFPHYPPFDNMLVNFKTNELSDSSPAADSRDWFSTYKCKLCPKDLLEK